MPSLRMPPQGAEEVKDEPALEIVQDEVMILADQSYIGGRVGTLDTDKPEEVIRNRNGIMLKALEGQRLDESECS